MPSRLALYLAAMLTLAAGAAHGEQIRIGVIVPLTGDMAVHGVEVQQAMRLAEREGGPSKHQYELLFEDNSLEGARSVSAARKLLDADKVDAVVTLWPPTALVVAPLTEQKKVLHYTIAWDPAIARQHRYILSHQAMVHDIARSTLRLIKQSGWSRPAFLHMEEVGFDMGASILNGLAPEMQVHFVADERFSPEERDARSLVTRIEAQQPDGYLIWSVMPSIDIIIRRIRERNPGIPITGYLDYAQDTVPLQNATYVSEMFSSGEFRNKYKSAYGSEPESKGPNAFDIYNLLVFAYEHAASSKPAAEELKTILTNVRNREGAVGTFSIDEFGNSSYSPVWRRVSGGQRVLADSR